MHSGGSVALDPVPLQHLHRRQVLSLSFFTCLRLLLASETGMDGTTVERHSSVPSVQLRETQLLKLR